MVMPKDSSQHTTIKVKVSYVTELLIWSDPRGGRGRGGGQSQGWEWGFMERKEEQKLLALIKINFV